MTRQPRIHDKAISAAAADLRAIVLTLRPTGPNGFEGLIRDIISGLTGWDYRLKTPGFQGAVDAVAIQQGTRHVLEAKLYRKSAGLARHMMASVAYSASAALKPDLLVFAATVEIDADTSARVRRLAQQHAIEVVVLDWHGELPDLAVVLAANPFLLPDFLSRIRRRKACEQARSAIRTLLSSPTFSKARNRLVTELSAATRIFEMLLRASIRQHDTAMSDRSLALRTYGQALCPLGPGTDRVITRDETLLELDAAAKGTAPVRKVGEDKTFITTAPVVVLGDEGVGKTWLVAQWWLTRHRDCIFLFIPSHRFRGIESDVATILSDSLRALLDPDLTADAEETWRRRLVGGPIRQSATPREPGVTRSSRRWF